MLHFTRKGSSDVTGFDLFTILLTWKVLRDLNLDLPFWRVLRDLNLDLNLDLSLDLN